MAASVKANVYKEEIGGLHRIDNDRKPAVKRHSVKREESAGPQAVKTEESTPGSVKTEESPAYSVKSEEATPKRARYQEDTETSSSAPPVKNEDPLLEDDAETSNEMGDEEVGENSVDAISTLPKSIDDIIRYMDRLEPDQGYFERQADSRDGCSKTRRKLRIFADKNMTHPAVSHRKRSGSWTPPNKATLDSMIQLLKEMIP